MQSLTRFRSWPDVSNGLFMAFAAAVWIAGGSSRADVMGQALVRGAAWACLVALVLFGPRRLLVRGRVIALFIAACVALAAFQLIPLPPSWWAALPGRSAYAQADAIVGGSAPWRPIAIAPGYAISALGSLIVPLVTLLLLADPRRIEDATILRVLVCMIVASMVCALLQFAGIPFYIPFINGGDEISGNLANRNHFAVLMAWGLLLVPLWAFDRERMAMWRAWTCAALMPLLIIAILASGSRMGMALGLAALAAAIVLVRRPLRRLLRRYPPWVLPALVAGIVGGVMLLVAMSVAAGRALSVSRALALDPSQDMRSSGLPTVLAMIREYFPIGSGLGGFDTVFRQHEPYHLLKLTYFNRAHNDYLEVVLDAGLPGLVLLFLALVWWTTRSFQIWRRSSESNMRARAASVLLAFVLIASVVDYPARTPIFMMLIVVAAIWLDAALKPALPRTEQSL